MKKVTVGANKKDASKDAKAAVQELEAYMKKHKLKDGKDYSKDKVHGPVIAKFESRIKLGHTKATEGLKEKAEAGKKLKKPEIHKKVKDAPAPNTYEYPTLKGKPMSPDQKSKYRSKMRPLLKSGMDPKKASTTVIEKYFTGTEFPTKAGIKKQVAKEELPKTIKKIVGKVVTKKIVKKSSSKREED